jgi:protein-tyrosine kinase
MGRIDEALGRSNVDAARGTGASTAAAGPSPWLFEQHDGGDGTEPAKSVVGEPVAEARRDCPAPGEDQEPTPWGPFDARATERFVASRTAGPLLVEQFRSLAATLTQAQNERRVRSAIVTSASPRDGKSFVAVNLALTLGQSYQRQVLLIDGDLRRPSLHQLFKIPNTPGLSEGLKADADAKLPVVQISETLSLVPAGRPDSDPLGSLSSDRMKRIIEEAVSRFDWVIVDTPPVGMRADGRVLSEMVDTTILVVRAGATRFPDLEAAAGTIGHDRILGIVLNAVDPIEIRGEDYYRHYYRDETADERRAG